MPGVRVDDLDASNFSVRRLQAEREHQFFATAYAHVWTPHLRRMINERFLAQARRVKPNVSERDVIVAIKEPNGSQSADILMAVQPTARLLFLLRDGRDVVDSQVAGSAEGAWPSENFPGVVGVAAAERLGFAVTSAYKWLWQTEVVQEAFGAHPGPKMQLRYEDLLSDPAKRMGELLGWLGLDVADDQIRAVVDRHAFDKIPESERGPTRFHRAATPGSWKQNLTSEECDRIEEILGPKLRELGYPVG
jgi:hypothetical protein